MDDEKKQKLIDYYVQTIGKGNREGLSQLLTYMEDDLHFWDAPCSGGNHLCEESGLLQHSCNVMQAAEKIGKAVLGTKNYKKMAGSIALVAGLHDLGKCGDHGKQFYIPNILKSGKQSEAKPFERNKLMRKIPHSVRSLIIAERFIDLSDDEEWAIYAHDGLYDTAKYEIPGGETQLLLILHWADMWASQIMEQPESADAWLKQFESELKEVL